MYSEQLKVREWLFVITGSTVIILLALFALVGDNSFENMRSYDEVHFVKEPRVVVRIYGAVNKPGTYLIAKGALLTDAISLAEPFADVDMKRFNLNAPIIRSRTIKVPSQKKITVFVEDGEGVVKKVEVPQGTLTSQLQDYVDVPPEVLKANTLRSRKLRNKEKIRLNLSDAL